MTDVITTPGVRLSDAAIRRRMIADFWFYFRQNRGAVIGLAVFILLVLVAIFAPILAPHDPTQQYRDALLVPPVWQDVIRGVILLAAVTIDHLLHTRKRARGAVRAG